jgi:CRISPR-associated endonuclease Csn1
MAIYEGTDTKGRTKRSFQLLNNLEAAKYFNGKTSRYDLVPQSDKDGYPLKCIIRTGTMVLFYEKTPDELYDCSKAELAKRLYKVTGMAGDGRIRFTYHQEARDDKTISAECGMGISQVDVKNPVARLRLTLGNLNMYVEGYDFDLTVTGEIKFKR